jgi:hypothetical protein
MKIKFKNFLIESEITNSDPAVDTTISKGRYFGSIGAAEHEGLSDKDGNTMWVPPSVIDKAYDLEDQVRETL